MAASGSFALNVPRVTGRVFAARSDVETTREPMSTATVNLERAGSPAGRYSERRSLHSVTSYCDAPNARRVALIGDFNDWNPNAHPMQRTPDGRWTIRLDLRHGHYRYLFLVDGQPRLDPRAHGVVREPNEWHDTLSLLEVS